MSFLFAKPASLALPDTRLISSGGDLSPRKSPTVAQLITALQAVQGRRLDWVGLHRISSHAFIQTAREGRKWRVEFNVGDTDNQHGALVEDLQTAYELLVSWSFGELGARKSVEWVPLDMSTCEGTDIVARKRALIKQQKQADADAMRAAAAAQRDGAKASRASYKADREAEVAVLNRELAASRRELHELLQATIDVDNFVDLEALKRTAVHPPFAPGALGIPLPPAPDPVYPVQPHLAEPPKPSGMFGKKRYEEELGAARHTHQMQRDAWDLECRQLHAAWGTQTATRDASDQQRQQALHEAHLAYRDECRSREDEAHRHNADLDELISGLSYGVVEAVKEYVAIVLNSSVYPADFPIAFDSAFDAASKELKIRAVVPSPVDLPAVKEYKYVSTRDEITSTDLSKTALKELYTQTVSQAALRILHEVFEGDRRSHVMTISLEAGTNGVNSATGRDQFIPLVVVAAPREQIVAMNLDRLTPADTLVHLGASISKNMFDLAPAAAAGIRGLK